MTPDRLDALGMKIVGYCDRPSVAVGEPITFATSCYGEMSEYRANIVRLIHGDLNVDGPGFKEEVIEAEVSGMYPARRQEIQLGSYGLVEDHPLLRGRNGFSVQAMLWPTTVGKGPQGIMTKWLEPRQEGWALVIDAVGAVALWLGDGTGKVDAFSTGMPLSEKCWYLVAASFDVTTGQVRVYQDPIRGALSNECSDVQLPKSGNAEGSSRVRVSSEGAEDVPLVFGGWCAETDGGRRVVGGNYNGKLDRPRVACRALTRVEVAAAVEDPLSLDDIAGAWDFAANITPAGIRKFNELWDSSPNLLHGAVVNLPTRGVTGYSWTGREHRYVHAPSEYGAIHFHDDDLEDAGWETDFTWIVPTELDSGIYAARLEAEEHEDYVPFVVRPKAGRGKARIALLVPTVTYLAYANDHLALDGDWFELATARTPIFQHQDLHHYQKRQYGLAMYDTHSDGSGVCYSSWLRPILNLRPKYRHALNRVWTFNADLHLVDWLSEMGHIVEFITDHDLHREGVSLLRDYKVVVTGSHPEYSSEAMLDALDRYLQDGGRLMYLGGNGFYWVTGVHPENPNVIEIRRWGGTENWTAGAGEYYLSFTGEMGGLWRNRGRPPQKLVGVGFVAEGHDISTYYRRMPDSFEPGARWIFDGVADEVIGDFGLLGNGAAGAEIDSVDPALGSPRDVYLLASSEGHTRLMLEVRENFSVALPDLGGGEQALVRADMVYFRTPKGGGVFSTGSIAWCASLSHNGYDNNVSRITENVLQGFVGDEPLPG